MNWKKYYILTTVLFSVATIVAVAKCFKYLFDGTVTSYDIIFPFIIVSGLLTIAFLMDLCYIWLYSDATEQIVIKLTPSLRKRFDTLKNNTQAPNDITVITESLRFYEWMVHLHLEGTQFLTKKDNVVSTVQLFDNKNK